MNKKEALVVDDSKLARFVLKEMLVEQGFQVVTVESAEEALGYLCAHRPDVIFMDHTMPGMDGFSAVKAIKRDPKTAMIPIMMYTSKAGEVYCSQARALGAVAVLPKQLKPVHLEQVLRDLHLLPSQMHSAENRKNAENNANSYYSKEAIVDDILVDDMLIEDSPNSDNNDNNDNNFAIPTQTNLPIADKTPTDIPEIPLPDDHSAHHNGHGPFDELEDLARSAVESAESKSLRNTLKRLLHEHRLLLRKDIESNTGRIVRVVLDELNVDAPYKRSTQTGSANKQITARVALVVLIALLPSLWLAVQYKFADDALQLSRLDNQRLQDQQNSSLDEFVSENESMNELIDSLKTEANTRNALLYRTVEWALNSRNTYPHNGVPFGEQTLQTLSTLVTHLSGSGFQGIIKLESHVGQFCLTENTETDNWIIPAENLSIAQCQMTDLTESEALSLGELQTIEFGNYLSNFLSSDKRSTDNANLNVQVESLGNQNPLIPYPTFDPSLTAGNWNRIAKRNNRVEVIIIPD